MRSAYEIINQAAKNLIERFHDEPLQAAAINDEIERIGRYKWNSVPPSDYCYNIVNVGSRPFKYAVFEWVGRGRYKYLGPNYKYTGPIFWKNEPVGEWKSGVYKFKKDPRRC